MCSKVIGIISYLPDEIDKRNYRFGKLLSLIQSCTRLFNLPIYIVVQNYREELSVLSSYRNVILSENYTRCGIVGARKKLREWFLNSPYDCLIMLDDDCTIVGSTSSAKKYLQEIDAHPNSFGEFKSSQLKLFSISKSILSEIDYEDVNPENGDGFEDTVFVETLRRKFPQNRFVFDRSTDLGESSVGANDPMSTWYCGQNLNDMLKKTDEKVKSL